MVKAEPGLISKDHMRPVLMIPVPVPACPYAALVAMIMSQSGASGWTSWAIPSCFRTSLDRLSRNTMSSSPDQLYLILNDERNLFLLIILIRVRLPFGVVILNWCPCGLIIAHRSPKRNRGDWRCPLLTLLCSLLSLSETAHDQTTEQWIQEFQVGY